MLLLEEECCPIALYNCWWLVKKSFCIGLRRRRRCTSKKAKEIRAKTCYYDERDTASSVHREVDGFLEEKEDVFQRSSALNNSSQAVCLLSSNGLLSTNKRSVTHYCTTCSQLTCIEVVRNCTELYSVKKVICVCSIIIIFGAN
ncbi:unnamed protein product [Cuscuta epithymum]|uniref:Uncharacterized protein n=1 Tax=Cuscuta epithymum TaxID=186058 RepID=A0AAV0ET50_9ASTE|nr:unnamed protein product [Cuscuta epithymum]